MLFSERMWEARDCSVGFPLAKRSEGTGGYIVISSHDQKGERIWEKEVLYGRGRFNSCVSFCGEKV